MSADLENSAKVEFSDKTIGLLQPETGIYEFSHIQSACSPHLPNPDLCYFWYEFAPRTRQWKSKCTFVFSISS